MHTVAIFRNQLFKRSEPFIVDQAQRISQFRILYVGRSRFSAPPSGADSAVLSDLSPEQRFTARLRQAVLRNSEPYARLLAGRGIRLIHAHFGVDAIYALPLAIRLGVPLVTTFHGYDATMTDAALLRSGKPAWWNYVLYRRHLAAQGDHFLCVSEYVRRKVIELGFPAAKTRVHYIGLDSQKIAEQPQRSIRPTVLHVARLVEKKGTKDLINAFSHVIRSVSDAELLIIGEGPLEQSLRALAHEHGLGDSVRFLGPRSHAEVLEHMSRAWVFSLPSVRARSGDAEGLGMVLLEAAASGVPAVANRHGGIPEVVIHGETGFLCEEHDISALSRGLVQLLTDEQLRKRMGHAARTHVLKNFDLEAQTASLERLYGELLEQRT